MSENNDISISELITNFPFGKIRPKQLDVLHQIGEAINIGYKFIVLEAPTGFGKSPIAVALGRTLGNSYICSATKELQTQYTLDFPYLKAVKGMANYDCLVKEDFILNKTFECGVCKISQRNEFSRSIVNECNHKNAIYGPCRADQAGYAHIAKNCNVCSLGGNGFHDGCRYRTYRKDYEVVNANSDREDVIINTSLKMAYQHHSTIRDGLGGWFHLINITRPEPIEKRLEFTPCPYYDQLNKGMLASHSIFNYANFLIFISANMIKPRKLLVLDEGHQIENQLVEKIGFSISKRSLQKFMAAANLFENSKYGYNDDIKTTWLDLLDRIYCELQRAIPNIGTNEVKSEAKQYLKRLEDTITAIKIDPKNWIISEIVYDNNNEIDVATYSTHTKKILKVTFKPLSVAPYCKSLFEQGDTTLIMSATILDFVTFCENTGLNPNTVKFIEVGSDFPVANRPVYKMNTAYLNYNSLQIESVQRTLVNAIDKIMDRHANDKGIIHTTSYAQVRFIERFLSIKNRTRLISTDPEVPREEIISKHWLESNKKSVLISPSLHTGLDLKNSQSRFQIIVKIPYPSKADRWIAAKMRIDGGRWYNWQTALRLVQSCGRSIRSIDDWAKTYVLDSYFDHFIGRNKLPIWFREAIV